MSLPAIFAGFRSTFRALQHRNYRLFFAGQGISMVGTWMQMLAMSWLVYKLARQQYGGAGMTDAQVIAKAAFLLGLVAFVSQIPTFIVSPLAGVWADRWDKRKVVLVTQTLAMLQALTLAGLTFAGVISIAWILPLGLLAGLISAFDIPTRQAMVVQMVDDRADLPNAIALNSSLVNGARLVGPALAGIIIGVAGEAVCFLVNGLSYIAVIAALLAMRIPPRQIQPRKHVLRELKDGFTHTYGFAPLRDVLLLLAVVSLMGVSYNVLMPVFAKDILHGGSETQGFLVSSAGTGAFIGAIFLASRRTVRGLIRLITLASGGFGAALIAFSFSRWQGLSMVILVVAGCCMMLQMAGSNTFLQTIAEDDKRGRIMSFYTMSFMGMAPFGALIAGGLARLLSAPAAVRIGGAVCVLSALLFATRIKSFRELVRPIYIKKGIIPPPPEEPEGK